MQRFKGRMFFKISTIMFFSFNLTKMANFTSTRPRSINCSLRDFDIVALGNGKDHLDAVYEIQVLTCVLNAIFSFVATLANGLIVVAIAHTPSLHTPSNVLLASLSLTDGLTGFIVQPAVVVVSALIARSRDDTFNMITHLGQACTAFTFYAFFAVVLSGTALCNLTALSVDKYLALRLHLRYRQIVTIQRVFIVEIVFLLGCIVCATVMILNQRILAAVMGAIAVGICLPLSFVAQMRVFAIARQHERKVVQDMIVCSRLEGLEGQQTATEIAKVKKNTRTVLIMWLALFVSTAPFTGAIIAFALKGFTPSINKAINIGVTLVFVNSSVNPFLYSMRMTPIRCAVLRLLSRRK